MTLENINEIRTRNIQVLQNSVNSEAGFARAPEVSFFRLPQKDLTQVEPCPRFSLLNFAVLNEARNKAQRGSR